MDRGVFSGLSKEFWRLLVISSCLDIHIPTFRLCFFFSVLLGVCVSVCVYMGRGAYIYIYICMSFKHLGDYLLSRMFGNFKGKMERINESDYCLAT